MRVRAINSAGNSDWSTGTGTPEAPAAQKPDAPSALTVNVGDGELEVSWTKPAENGDSITKYKVRYSEGDSGTPTEFEVTGTSTTITGLTNGQSYQVQVQAVSLAGNSDWSTGTGTPALPPDAPAKPTLTPGNGQLGVSWTEPSDNGAPISDYDVWHRVTTSSTSSTSDDWTKKKHTDATLTTTITGLTNGQSYDVKVRARSLAGDSEWSESTTGTPEHPGSPKA